MAMKNTVLAILIRVRRLLRAFSIAAYPVWTPVEVISNCYTMGCPPVRGDNPRALASGLSYVQVDKHGITILYHLHQCRPCTTRGIYS